MIILGDTHGNWEQVKQTIETYDLKNETIIGVGDIGAGIEDDSVLREFGDFLSPRGLNFKSIRGNHDNPAYFPWNFHPSVQLIGDYQELTIEGQKILFIGGAISIDRQSRVEGLDYWSEEQIQEPPDNLSYNYDIIISHDLPFGIGPTVERLRDDIRFDVILGRRILERIYGKTYPKKWFCGHYHRSQAIVQRNTAFKIVGINELICL